MTDAGSAFEARAAMMLHARQAGVRDIAVLRAIETVAREKFVPHRFRDLADRNIALPIGCGQTMSTAADLAWRLQALDLASGHRLLEIGTGSGYGAATAAAIVRDVVSIERFETLAIEAAGRLARLPAPNVLVLHGDGLSPSRSLGSFDRIIVHASVPATPAALSQMLAPDGVMLLGRAAPGDRAGARLLRIVRRGPTFVETDLGPCRLGAATPGAAQAL